MQKNITNHEINFISNYRKEQYLKIFYKKISLTPICFNKKMWNNIQVVSENMSKLVEKTIRFYYKSDKMSMYYNLNNKQKTIIDVLGDRDKSVYISRYDAFLEKDNIKFLEFNINFPGGIERLDRLFDKVKDYCIEFDQYKNIKNTNSIKVDFLKMIKSIYPGSGMFAMVYGSQFDKMSFGSADKIAETVKKTLGIDTNFMHWNELNVEKNRLSYKGKKIGLVFRMTLDRRMWQYDYSLAKKVLLKIKQLGIPMFNLPQAYFAGRKDLFAIWHEEWFRKNLNQKEKKLIEKHIPRTYLMSNKKLNVNEINEKNKWVIKPVTGYGGKGVYVGKKMTDNYWKKIFKKHLGSNEWIVQEYVNSENINIIEFDTHNETLKQINGYVNISPWLINGKLSGITGRYSKDLIINVKKGGGIIPIFIKE